MAFRGGGEATAAILGGNVTVGGSGYSEFAEYIKTGKMRAIGVTSEKRLPGIDVPTLKEQGIDVVIGNWRGVYGAPGITPEQRKAAHMENARIEGGLLVQEVCITPEMAGRTLQSIVDAQAKDLPGCSAPEIHTDGDKESLVLACGDGQFRLSLQAEYASPTDNTVRSSMSTPGGSIDSTVRSRRIGDC